MHRFEPGGVVLIRHISRSDGSVGSAIPARVVRDDGSELVLYITAGTQLKSNWATSASERVDAIHPLVPSASADRPHQDRVWLSPALRFYLPNRWYSVWLHFDLDFNVKYWYGNLEAPHVRTSLGVDTCDLALDVVVMPDGSWRWKDEEEFRTRLEWGLIRRDSKPG